MSLNWFGHVVCIFGWFCIIFLHSMRIPYHCESQDLDKHGMTPQCRIFFVCTVHNFVHCPHLTLTWPMVRIIWFGVYTYPKPCFFRLDRFGFIIHAYMWVFYGVLRIEDLPWMQESNGRISRMKKQLGLNHLLLCTSR